MPVGRSFFTAPQDGRTTIDLGDGLELWYGFYQSAILGWKPFLNVDGEYYYYFFMIVISYGHLSL